VLASALFSRFSSRGEGDYGNKLLSAMRKQFGGHAEQQLAAEQGADPQNTSAS
jgi:6-phosphogluconate dehydrogenase